MSGNTVPVGGDTTGLTARIVGAYVASNPVPAADLPALIGLVHTALSGLTASRPAEQAPAVRPTAAQVRRSIAPDHLVSFEDGKPYKTLRRHLTLRGLTPEAYREKWGLPRDYPMTAPHYSALRAELARAVGLGLRRGGSAAPVP